MVNAVLPELAEEEKKTFLKNLLADDHEKTWQHLKSHTQDIENKLRSTLSGLKQEILTDIQEARAKKEN